MGNFRDSCFAHHINLRYAAYFVLCFESLVCFLLITLANALPSFHEVLGSTPRHSMRYLLRWNFRSTFSSTELSSEVVTVHTMQVSMRRGFLTLTLAEGEWRVSSFAAFALGKELQVRTEQQSEWFRCRSRHFRKEKHVLGKFLALGTN